MLPKKSWKFVILKMFYEFFNEISFRLWMKDLHWAFQVTQKVEFQEISEPQTFWIQEDIKEIIFRLWTKIKLAFRKVAFQFPEKAKFQEIPDL